MRRSLLKSAPCYHGNQAVDVVLLVGRCLIGVASSDDRIASAIDCCIEQRFRVDTCGVGSERSTRSWWMLWALRPSWTCSSIQLRCSSQAERASFGTRAGGPGWGNLHSESRALAAVGAGGHLRGEFAAAPGAVSAAQSPHPGSPMEPRRKRLLSIEDPTVRRSSQRHRWSTAARIMGGSEWAEAVGSCAGQNRARVVDRLSGAAASTAATPDMPSSLPVGLQGETTAKKSSSRIRPSGVPPPAWSRATAV